MQLQEQTISEDIRDIIAGIIEVEPSVVTPHAHLVKDLGADSMVALEIVAACEKRYGVVIDAESFPALTSLSEITALVSRLQHGA